MVLDLNSKVYAKTTIQRTLKVLRTLWQVYFSRAPMSIDGSFITQDSGVEIKVSGFLAKDNLHFASADPVRPLFKTIFPDSKNCESIFLSQNKSILHLERCYCC